MSFQELSSSMGEMILRMTWWQSLTSYLTPLAQQMQARLSSMLASSLLTCSIMFASLSPCPHCFIYYYDHIYINYQNRGNRTQTRHSPAYCNTMSYYRFPTSLEGFHLVDSPRAFENKLADAYRAAGLAGNLYIQTIAKPEAGQVYFRCVFGPECKWGMKYERGKQASGPYRLARFNLYHCHPNSKLEGALQRRKRPDQMTERDGIDEVVSALAEMDYSYMQCSGYISYLTGLSFMSARMMFYKCQTGRLVADFDGDFHEWFQTYRGRSLHIVTYPPIQRVFYLPEMVFISCRPTMRLYRQRGHILGIKLIDNKVKDLSPSFQKYICVVFYGYLGYGIHILFGFAILSLGPELEVQPGEGQQRKPVKIYSNLYKILEVFHEVMGPTMKTILVEDKDRAISVAQYFVQNINKRRPKSCPLKLIVDPMDTIHRRYPKGIRPLLANLIKAQSEQEFTAMYRRSILDNQELSVEEVEMGRQFYEDRARFMMLSQEEPKFVGRWFDQLHYFSYEFIDSKPTCKRSLLFLLVYVSNTFVFLKRIYDRKFGSMVEHAAIEDFLHPELFARPRMLMYRDGFRLLAQQLFLAHKINCAPFQTDLIPDSLSQGGEGDRSWANLTDSMDDCLEKLDLPMCDYYAHRLTELLGDGKANERQSQKEGANNKKIDQLYARYQDLYPIRPPTSISLEGAPPQACTYQDGGRYFTCRLESVEPEVRYRCDCNFMAMRGIPCRHILKTSVVQGLPIDHYISEYWKLRRPYDEERQYRFMERGREVPKLGRPRQSTRNRMRFR